MIHVALFPADEFGCGHYRMRLPAEHAPVITTLHERVKTNTSPNLRRGTVDLHYVDVGEADVVVFQRPTDHRLVPVIEKLKQQGVAVVVEIDDDLSCLAPEHSSFQALHPAQSPFNNWDHLRAACRAADLVTVTTPALARRYGGHGRTVVLPNAVDAKLLDLESTIGADFGWGGVVGTHPRDLDVLGDTVRRLVDGGLSFELVGDPTRAEKALGLDYTPTHTGWLDMDDYHRAIASLRVGLVPLHNSAFNHAKSALKGLEYAALGVPFVASPLPEYRRLVNAGLGRLATRPRQWARQIAAALEEWPDEGEEGRAIVRERFTIQGEAWRWAEAWQRAVENRRRIGRKAA